MSNPFIKLDTYEREIESAFESGAYQSNTNKKNKALLKKLKTATNNTLVKNATVNFRVNKFDLMRFKAKAHERGIPYQTLLASMIRQYVTGEKV